MDKGQAPGQGAEGKKQAEQEKGDRAFRVRRNKLRQEGEEKKTWV
jgi:hypothetical protein